MSKSVKAVKNAPSAKAQERAFLDAQSDVNVTTFGELTHTASKLLVSKGGKKSYAQLFDKIADLCDEYPLDVAALASLQFAGNALSGYLAYLDLNRTETGTANDLSTSTRKAAVVRSERSESKRLPLDATIAALSRK